MHSLVSFGLSEESPPANEAPAKAMPGPILEATRFVGIWGYRVL